MRQFTTSLLLVPHDLPVNVMDADTLVRAIDDGAALRKDYLAFVHPRMDYVREFLRRLAPPMRFDKV